MHIDFFETAELLLQKCWQLLDQASREGRHPLRTPVVGTVGSGGRQAELRTVVLRAVDPAARRLTFYTDRRSPKVEQLRQSQRVSWLFYDPGLALQIRATGEAVLHSRDEAAASAWRSLPAEHRKNYGATMPSGTAIEAPGQELPALWMENPPALEHTDYAFDHFLLVATVVEEIEGLLLHEQGHRRAQFRWSGEKQVWKGGWIVP